MEHSKLNKPDGINDQQWTLVEMAIWGAEEIRERGEQVNAAGFVLTQDGVEMYAFADFDDCSRTIIMKKVDKWVAEGSTVVLNNEAFVTKLEGAPGYKPKMAMRPRDDPDRAEVCIVQLFLPDKRHLQWQREIVDEHFIGVWSLVEVPCVFLSSEGKVRNTRL